MPFECNYCGAKFCSDHRMPEAHDCDGVEFLSASDRLFKEKDTGTVVRSREDIERPDPIKPEYTVGTAPEPEYEGSPDTELKESAKLRIHGKPETKERESLYNPDSGLSGWIRKLFR